VVRKHDYNVGRFAFLLTAQVVGTAGSDVLIGYLGFIFFVGIAATASSPLVSDQLWLSTGIQSRQLFALGLVLEQAYRDLRFPVIMVCTMIAISAFLSTVNLDLLMTVLAMAGVATAMKLASPIFVLWLMPLFFFLLLLSIPGVWLLLGAFTLWCLLAFAVVHQARSMQPRTSWV